MIIDRFKLEIPEDSETAKELKEILGHYLRCSVCQKDLNERKYFSLLANLPIDRDRPQFVMDTLILCPYCDEKITIAQKYRIKKLKEQFGIN